MVGHSSYLKKHTETLVKDVGIEPACELTGKSKATLGRYYSDHPEHSDRFMPIDAVINLEKAAGYRTLQVPSQGFKASPCHMTSADQIHQKLVV